MSLLFICFGSTLKMLEICRYIICIAMVSANAPTVHIEDSIITGKEIQLQDSTVNQFLGVPYAEPPIGTLRFSPTQPLARFPETFEAVTQPPACHQYATVPPPWADSSGAQSEDCLYLNIWTPAGSSAFNTKAVMFWVHGGVFRAGSIRLDVYNGTALAALGDIVVVTVGYRLGTLGFLTSSTEDAPGNAGFWDILEGLRWIRKNIKAFGGDSDRITFSGESAGSISILVGLLSVSPLSRGLFRRQIMESGSPAFLLFENSTRNEGISEYISSQVGCSNDKYTMKEHAKEVIDCLRKVDAAIFPKIESKILNNTSVSLSPQYGDEIVPFNPRQAILNGNFYSTELLMGVNENEGTPVTADSPEIFGINGGRKPHLNKTAAREYIRKLFEEMPNPDPIVHYYFPDTMPENAFEAIEQQIFKAYGEGFLLCPTLYHAEKASERKRVYFYYWGHRSSSSAYPPRLGAPHFEEVQFVFGRPVREPQNYSREDIDISVRVIGMWSSFVKYGKPSFSWPLFTRSSPQFKFFGTKSEQLLSNFHRHQENCDFWRSYFGF